MGYNTTVIVMNDALHDIENDPEFGKKLARAITEQWGTDHKGIDVSAGSHVNAATVIEQHHANEMIAVAVGGNLGRSLGWSGGYLSTDIDIVRNLADRLGFRLVKKNRNK